MLEVQKFIKANPNWKELLSQAPYNLKIEEKGNYVLLKYNMLDTDFSYEISKECRGIILKKPDFKVVRQAFYKFFNLGEKYCSEIDWDSATATEKMDGSLISLWYDDDEWHISTNGKIDARDAALQVGGFNTFYDLALKTFEDYGLDFNTLNKDYIYTFELCTSFNQVVIIYEGRQLYHILTRDKNTLEEIDYTIENIPKPRYYELNSQKDYEELVNSFDANKEGIVIKDKFNNRVKLKTLSYFELHKKCRNHSIDEAYALDLILKGDEEEFLTYFPTYRDFFNETKSLYEQAIEKMYRIAFAVTNWKLCNSELKRADFAKMINTQIAAENQKFYFLAYDNKLLSTIDKMPATNLVKFLHIK